MEGHCMNETERTDESPDEGGPPSWAVVQALTAETGTPPEDVRPLYDSIDPEALDHLLGRSDTAIAQITFEHMGYRIAVRGARDVRLDEVGE